MRAGAVALVALVGGGVALLVAKQASAASPAPAPAGAKPIKTLPPVPPQPAPLPNPNGVLGGAPVPYKPPTTSESPAYDCYADQDVRDQCAAFAATFGTATGSEPLWQIYFDQCMAQQCEPTALTSGARTRAILERTLRQKAFVRAARTGVQLSAPPRPKPPLGGAHQMTSPARAAYYRRGY